MSDNELAFAIVGSAIFAILVGWLMTQHFENKKADFNAEKAYADWLLSAATSQMTDHLRYRIADLERENERLEKENKAYKDAGFRMFKAEGYKYTEIK